MCPERTKRPRKPGRPRGTRGPRYPRGPKHTDTPLTRCYHNKELITTELSSTTFDLGGQEAKRPRGPEAQRPEVWQKNSSQNPGLKSRVQTIYAALFFNWCSSEDILPQSSSFRRAFNLWSTKYFQFKYLIVPVITQLQKNHWQCLVAINGDGKAYYELLPLRQLNQNWLKRGQRGPEAQRPDITRCLLDQRKRKKQEAQRPRGPRIPKRPKTHRNPIDEMLSQRGPNPNWTFKYNIRPERPRGLEAQRSKDRKFPEAQRPRSPKAQRPKRPIHHQLMFIHSV